MTAAQRNRITWSISLGGVLTAVVITVSSAWAWTSSLETRIGVLESQYQTLLKNQRYIIERVDEIALRRDGDRND